LNTRQEGLIRSYLTMIAATVLFILLCLLGPITRWHALILLAGMALMLWDSFRQARGHEADISAEVAGDASAKRLSGGMTVFYLALGFIGLPLGADLLVDGATGIARGLGVSETVIGLTLVAVGTSLPELAASTAAALRGQTDMAIGNVIGSNVFNLLGIIGVAGLVAPLQVPPEMLRFDLWVMLATALLIAPFLLLRRHIGRRAGLGLLAAYLAFILVLIY
ncbi:sodium:calcium antiporter, partial [Thioclava sp. BHET1]